MDLDDVVDQEIRRLRSTSRHQVSADLAPVRIRGDARRIGQVLRNVLDNAERHALSRIRVVLRTTDTGAVITVDNDGDPVPEADRDADLRTLRPARREPVTGRRWKRTRPGDCCGDHVRPPGHHPGRRRPRG